MDNAMTLLAMLKVEIDSRRARTALRGRNMRTDLVVADLKNSAAAIERAIAAADAGDYAGARADLEMVSTWLRTESWHLAARDYAARIRAASGTTLRAVTVAA